MTESGGIAAEYAARARGLFKKGQIAQARTEVLEGLSSAPDDIPLLQLLADSADLLNFTDEAVDACNRLTVLLPGNAMIYAKIGDLWTKAFDYARAEEAFQTALRLDPANTLVIDRLANLFRTSGKTAEAKEILSRRAAMSADPQTRAAQRFQCVLVQPVIARDNAEIDQARTDFMAAVSAGPETLFADPYRLGLGPNFYSGYQAHDELPLQRALAQYYLAATPSLSEAAAHVGARTSGRPIRVGLVCHYFSKHTIGYLSYGLVSLLDRQRFELVLFRTPNSRRDGDTGRFAAAAPLIDLAPGLAQARRQIADARLDVLHFPEIGMEPLTYFLAFARLATVQTVAWGHPITTGIPNVDYFLSPNDMEPDNANAHYSERLLRLKNLTFAGAHPGAPSPFDHQIEKDRPSYVCVQSLFKVHPDFDATLAQILRRDAKGIIYFVTFLPYPDGLLKARLECTLGADIARVRFLPRMTTGQFRHLVGSADVILDVTQWSGGKTALDTFAAGTPIVHQPGAFMRGRHTLAFYRKMGITAPVAASPEGYADVAVRLANDRAFHSDVKAQIVATSPKLFNDVASIREIEEVWETALRERC